MKAFLLAAGFGERLRPLTESVPKSLIPIAGIPSICYSLMLLKEAGIDDVVCNLHYRSDDIVNFLKRNNFFGMNIEFSIEEKILGTGGGLKKCEDFFKDDDTILLNSDIITDIHIRDVIKRYNEISSPGLVTLYRNGTECSPPVSVNGNHVVDFKNFLKSNAVPEYDYMGIAVFSSQIFKYLISEFSSIVYTGFTDLIRYHSLGFYEHSGVWEDIGTIESLKKVEKKLFAEENYIRERVLSLFPDIV